MISSVDGEARKRANLRLLQRLDRWTVDIVGQATHVVLYEFREQEQRWDKLNVEGSLFVTQRGDAPRFKLFVLNRNSTRNLEVGVTPDFQMQLREPYLIFRDGDGDGDPANAATIRGLWFHDGARANTGVASAGGHGEDSDARTRGSDESRSWWVV